MRSLSRQHFLQLLHHKTPLICLRVHKCDGNRRSLVHWAYDFLPHLRGWTWIQLCRVASEEIVGR